MRPPLCGVEITAFSNALELGLDEIAGKPQVIYLKHFTFCI